MKQPQHAQHGAKHIIISINFLSKEETEHLYFDNKPPSLDYSSVQQIDSLEKGELYKQPNQPNKTLEKDKSHIQTSPFTKMLCCKRCLLKKK